MSRGTVGIVKYDGVGMCTESAKHGIHTEIMKKNLLVNDYSKDREIPHKVDLKAVRCEGGWRRDLVQDRVQW